MEILIIVFASLLMIAGIIGSFLPVLPGPPLSYIALLLAALLPEVQFGYTLFLYWGIVVVVVVSLEHIIPVVSSKKMGGSRYGMAGCIAGGILGIFFFPPFGIIFGPMIGAFAGELIAGQKSDKALRAAIGSFIGFFIGTVIKVVVCLVMAWQFVRIVIF